MTRGQSRFEYYLNQLEELIQNAKQTTNAAEYLYKNDGRTLCFMLESLARIYMELHNKKRFGKMKMHFKMLEDAMGNIDHYDAYIKEWHDYPNFPQELHIYLQQKYAEHVQQLNDILLNEYWMSEQDNRIEKFRNKLETADWQSAKKEMKGVYKFYKESIENIETFYNDRNGELTKIEEEVHELRRDLRWLSIYAKSMQGAIQLTNSAVSDSSLEPYLTEAIIHSPHTTLPAPGNNTVVLLLEKKYFLALSWMISALGDLKDEGLRVHALTEAVIAVSGEEKQEWHDAQERALQLLKKEPNQEQIILSRASQICADYFNANLLTKMLKGITEKKK